MGSASTHRCASPAIVMQPAPLSRQHMKRRAAVRLFAAISHDSPSTNRSVPRTEGAPPLPPPSSHTVAPRQAPSAR
eukprot:1054919-Prymnesium_polylepis.1